MIAGLDTLLTALYVELTDHIIPARGFTRREPGKPPEVTDAELVCIAVAQTPWVRMARAESMPAAMLVTWDSPLTWTGTALAAVVPSPSCPALLLPQAHTVPSDRNARLNPSPATILVTPVSPGPRPG